jgi:hypothetical protein
MRIILVEFEMGLDDKKPVCYHPTSTAPEIASPARRLLFGGVFL